MNASGTHAMVLSGGGAYAAYEVGVMKALFSGSSPATEYSPLDVGVLTGTSAGAFNVSIFLSAPPASDSLSATDYLESVWLNEIARASDGCGNGVFRFRPDFTNVLNSACYLADPVHPFADLASDALFFSQDWFSRAVNFLTSSGSVEQRTVELFDLATGLVVDRLERLMVRIVRPGQIRSSGKLIRITATNWKSGSVRAFCNSDFTDEIGPWIVLASASMPGIFHPIDIEGQPYVDGSVVTSTPLKEAIDAGGDMLHVVYMNPDAQNIPLPRVRNTASAIYRTMVMASAAMMNRDIEIARRVNADLQLSSGRADNPQKHRLLTIHRYHPRETSENGLGWLTFDRDYISGLIQQGFIDASEHDCEISKCILPN